jgi:putative flippase GtrA
MRGTRSFTTRRDVRQLIVFCAVGVALAAVYFVVACALSSGLGLKVAMASVTAYVLMIPLGYFAHRIITFRSSAFHKVAFPRFVVTQCLAVALSWLIPNAASGLFAAPRWLAFLAVCVVVPLVSFAAARAWVFVGSRDSPSRIVGQ